MLHFTDKGDSSDAGVRIFCGVKNFEFSKFTVCSHGQGQGG